MTSDLEAGERTGLGQSEAELAAKLAGRQGRNGIWLRDVVRVCVLLVTDLAALYSGALLAYLLWAYWILGQPLTVYRDVGQLLLLMPLGYGVAGLYPGFGIGAVESLRRMSYCTAFGFMLIAASTLLLKLPPTQSRVTFLAAWAAALITVPLFRLIVLAVVIRWKGWAEPVLLVGDGAWLGETISSLQNAKSIGFRPVGILAPQLRAPAIHSVPVWNVAEAASYLRLNSVRTAIIAATEERLYQIAVFQQLFSHVIIVQPNPEMPADGSRLLNLGGILGIDFRNKLLRWNNRVIKRVIDVSVALPAFVVAMPIVVAAGIFIKLRSPGPALFVQERDGYNGKPLRILKLRTMHVDAEERLTQLLEGDSLKRDEWNTRMKLRKDPRLIPGAQFLRRFSIDELPQLWHVVRGEMSLVGPRPFPSYHLSRFPPEFVELRRRVRPGLTGMWQVMARSDGGLDEQARYDTYYVRNWSLWLDIHLLTRTLLVVARGRGAY